MPDPFAGQLSIVAAAVTPVVMVSATAILISGVNARHISISDRIRALAREFRAPAMTPSRRDAIQREVVIFRRRMHLVSWATRMLYSAVFCFITVALCISAAVLHPAFQIATLPMFLVGLLLIAIAIVLQLIELSESNLTIDLEASDLLAEKHPDELDGR